MDKNGVQTRASGPAAAVHGTSLPVIVGSTQSLLLRLARSTRPQISRASEVPFQCSRVSVSSAWQAYLYSPARPYLYRICRPSPCPSWHSRYRASPAPNPRWNLRSPSHSPRRKKTPSSVPAESYPLSPVASTENLYSLQSLHAGPFEYLRPWSHTTQDC